LKNADYSVISQARLNKKAFNDFFLTNAKHQQRQIKVCEFRTINKK